MEEKLDIPMNELTIKSDYEYIYIELGRNQGKIKKSDFIKLLSSSFSTLVLGDTLSTDGSVLIAGKSREYILQSIGTEYSSGNICIQYGVRNTLGKWVSTCNLDVDKHVYVFSNRGIMVGVAESQIINVGEEVQLSWKKISFT